MSALGILNQGFFEFPMTRKETAAWTRNVKEEQDAAGSGEEARKRLARETDPKKGLARGDTDAENDSTLIARDMEGLDPPTANRLFFYTIWALTYLLPRRRRVNCTSSRFRRSAALRLRFASSSP